MKTRREKVIALVLLGLSLYLLAQAFDKNLYKMSDIEQIKISDRAGYYGKEMGDFYIKNRALRFYLNKFSPVVNKYLLKISLAFDIETYLPLK